MWPSFRTGIGHLKIEVKPEKPFEPRYKVRGAVSAEPGRVDRR